MKYQHQTLVLILVCIFILTSITMISYSKYFSDTVNIKEILFQKIKRKTDAFNSKEKLYFENLIPLNRENHRINENSFKENLETTTSEYPGTDTESIQ